MDFKKGYRFVYRPLSAVVSVDEVYVDMDEDSGVPVDMLGIWLPSGAKSKIERRKALAFGRPLMSVGEARQVLSILANTFAPVAVKRWSQRNDEARAALSSRQPLKMAMVLRELRVRQSGGGGAPVKIPFKEASIRSDLIAALCAELAAVLPADFLDTVGMAQGCEETLRTLSRRINPSPVRADVSRYHSVYKSFPSANLASELQTIARTVKKKATSNDTEHRADLNARQHALLHVIDSRSRRNDR